MTNFTFILNQWTARRKQNSQRYLLIAFNINHILVHYGIFRPALTEDYVLMTDMETL